MLVAAAAVAGFSLGVAPNQTKRGQAGAMPFGDSRAPLSQAAQFALAIHDSDVEDGGIPRAAEGLSAMIINGAPVVTGSSLSGSSAPLSSGISGGPATASRPTPPSAPKGAVRFVNDTSFVSQDETSVAALRFGKLAPDIGVFTGKQATNIGVLGSFNDFQAFFCPGAPNRETFDITCQGPYTGSLTGWTFSFDKGAHVYKGGLVPGVYTPNTVVDVVNKNSSEISWRQWSWGDPISVPYCTGATKITCGFYQVSLAINPFFGTNGIELSVADPVAMSNPSVDCTTTYPTSILGYFAPEFSRCFNGTFVYGNTTIGIDPSGFPVAAPSTFEDKPTAAVVTNPASALYGDVFIAWDHVNSDSTADGYLALCTPTLSCTMYSGGSLPVASRPDRYAAWTTAAVDRAGNAYIAWCNYGNLTSVGPVECRERSVTGPGTFGPTSTMFSYMGEASDVELSRQLPDTYVTQGFATEQFRTANIQAFAADTSGAAGLAGNLYFAISVCNEGNYYATSPPTVSPGNCGNSEIVFSHSSDSGTTWSAPAVLSKPAVNTQPTIAVDGSSGKVTVVWYTAVYDPFDHRLDVQAVKSVDGGNTFTSKRLTTVSNEPDADPLMYAYTKSLGGSWAAPQLGDYLGAFALEGKVYVLFTGDYKVITTPEGSTTQADPWLLVVTP